MKYFLAILLSVILAAALSVGFAAWLGLFAAPSPVTGIALMALPVVLWALLRNRAG